MPHTRIALSLAALLLGASCLTPAHADWFGFGSKDKPVATEKKPVATPDPTPAAQDLDGAIRQAQLLRTDRHYDEAIKTLSQIMLVAADDPRVVTEYGKTLAAMGRASDAINFLTRAQQLSPTDWTVYSALGVAYDQTGDQRNAQIAYEHALSLKPGEPSVLNNYALSRMLAKDTDGARQLIARAESAGGASDPKIARNITMMKDLAPATAVAANTPAPAQLPPSPAPRVAVARAPMPQMANAQPMPMRSAPMQPMSNGAPRPLVASNGVIDAAPMPVMPNQPAGVVMQRVPEDPLAGPVQPRIALHMPAPKKAPVKQAEAAPMPRPADAANALEAKAEAIAKNLANKPAAQAQAVAAASKPATAPAQTVAAASKPAASAPAAAKPTEKPVSKMAEAKPAPAPAKPAPAPVKAADAKAPVKTAEAKPTPAKATPKDQVPALRVSASAY